MLLMPLMSIGFAFASLTHPPRRDFHRDWSRLALGHLHLAFKVFYGGRVLI